MAGIFSLTASADINNDRSYGWIDSAKQYFIARNEENDPEVKSLYDLRNRDDEKNLRRIERERNKNQNIERKGQEGHNSKSNLERKFPFKCI